MPTFALKLKHVLGGGVILLWSVSSLYFYELGKESIKPKIETKVETKVEHKIEYVDRFITRTIKGDTITEVIHEKGKTETQVVEKKVEIEKPVKAELTRYSVAMHADINPINLRREYSSIAGARLGNLPIFLEAGYRTGNTVIVGARWEFK